MSQSQDTPRRGPGSEESALTFFRSICSSSGALAAAMRTQRSSWEADTGMPPGFCSAHTSPSCELTATEKRPPIALSSTALGSSTCHPPPHAQPALST